MLDSSALVGDEVETSKPQFVQYDASQLLELDVLASRTAWSFPTNSDLLLSSRFDGEDDPFFDEPGMCMI